MLRPSDLLPRAYECSIRGAGARLKCGKLTAGLGFTKLPRSTRADLDARKWFFSPETPEIGRFRIQPNAAIAVLSKSRSGVKALGKRIKHPT